MQILTPPPVAPPNRTLSVVTSTYIGEHTVRKAVGRLTHVYVGSEVVDRYTTLESTVSLTINEPMAIFVLSTNAALDVSIDGMDPINVTQFLLLDKSSGNIVITNTDAVTASVHITYLVLP